MIPRPKNEIPPSQDWTVQLWNPMAPRNREPHGSKSEIPPSSDQINRATLESYDSTNPMVPRAKFRLLKIESTVQLLIPMTPRTPWSEERNSTFLKLNRATLEPCDSEKSRTPECEIGFSTVLSVAGSTTDGNLSPGIRWNIRHGEILARIYGWKGA